MNKNGSLTTVDRETVRRDGEDLINKLRTLSGKEALERILNHEKPLELVRGLSSEDFFWLIKKVGEEDCLPLLQLAAAEQWQYLLDLEIWRKDRLDFQQAASWLGRLEEADPQRLVKWLTTEEERLSSFFLFKNIQVIIREQDEAFDLPPGFFSVDGVFYVRPLNPKNRAVVERLVRVLAEEDFSRYQALLLGLSGTIPAETEEEMYRLRNVRLAEHGFLPREEAVSLYAPLEPDALKVGTASGGGGPAAEEDSDNSVPVAPLAFIEAKEILKEATSRITAPELIDRIRLEFAGLCNQLISADGLVVDDLETLVETCRKVAGYLNLSLEEVSGKDVRAAERLVMDNPLSQLFRVGFGLALRVKWDVERWAKGSWHRSKGLEPSFWGERWGGVFAGLLGRTPRFYVGPGEEAFKEFETLSELESARRVFGFVQAIDGLLERLEAARSIDLEALLREETSFHPLLFNFWAGRVLGLDAPVAAISLEDARAFFQKIRAGEDGPPYAMAGWEKVFFRDLLSFVDDLEEDEGRALEAALGEVWSHFRSEYEWVPTDQLDPRYSRLLLIRP